MIKQVIVNKVIVNKVIVKRVIISLFIFFISIRGVNAYELPNNYYYIKCNESKYGEITLFIPSDKVSFLSLQEDSQIINISSNNIIGYSNDFDYTVSFQPFNYGRINEGYNNYYYLDILDIIDTNINFVNDSNMYINTNYQFLLIGVTILIFGGVILLWLRH